jgi:hypothetical protein
VYGNLVGGGLQIGFGLAGSSTSGTFGTVADNQNGTYTATFTATAPGSNTITATIGGQAITSTLPTVTVSAPPITLPLPLPPPPPVARSITARLVTMKVKKKTRQEVRVFFADTGEQKMRFVSPFQQPGYTSIRVNVRDRDGDGVADTVILTATQGKKTVTAQFPG